MRLPKAKSSEIAVQDLGKELLIYDLKTDRAFRLNETSMIVFNHCDGETSFDELKQKYKFTDDLVHLTLNELKKNDLLKNYESNHFNGLSRRDVIKRVGLTSMIALPVIAGISAPTAAHAQSGNVSCDTSLFCSCTLPSESTATTCTDEQGNCQGAGCVCILSGICSPSVDNKLCFGNCGVVIL